MLNYELGSQSLLQSAGTQGWLAQSGTRVIGLSERYEDLEARIDAVPSEATIRGMFLSQLTRLAPDMPDGQYAPLKMYPVRDYMRLLLLAARRRRCKGGHIVDDLLQLGFGVYPLFASSLAGSAIFAMANRDFGRVCELASRAYAVTLSPGAVRVAERAPESMTLELRDVWPFPDIFHVGIWLGAMDLWNVEGTIRVESHSLCDVDYHLRWRSRTELNGDVQRLDA